MGLSVLSCGGLSRGAGFWLAEPVGWCLEALLGFTSDESVQSKIALLISFASYNNLYMQQPSEPVSKPMFPTHCDLLPSSLGFSSPSAALPAQCSFLPCSPAHNHPGMEHPGGLWIYRGLTQAQHWPSAQETISISVSETQKSLLRPHKLLIIVQRSGPQTRFIKSPAPPCLGSQGFSGSISAIWRWAGVSLEKVPCLQRHLQWESLPQESMLTTGSSAPAFSATFPFFFFCF